MTVYCWLLFCRMWNQNKYGVIGPFQRLWIIADCTDRTVIIVDKCYHVFTRLAFRHGVEKNDDNNHNIWCHRFKDRSDLHGQNIIYMNYKSAEKSWLEGKTIASHGLDTVRCPSEQITNCWTLYVKQHHILHTCVLVLTSVGPVSFRDE